MARRWYKETRITGHGPTRGNMGRPPLKPDDDTRRITITAPESWAKRLDDWRRHQPDLPNLSEAIRRLVDLGMEASRKGKRR